MAGDISQVKGKTVLVQDEVVNKVATEVERRDDLVVDLEIFKNQGS